MPPARWRMTAAPIGDRTSDGRRTPGRQGRPQPAPRRGRGGWRSAWWPCRDATANGDGTAVNPAVAASPDRPAAPFEVLKSPQEISMNMQPRHGEVLNAAPSSLWVSFEEALIGGRLAGWERNAARNRAVIVGKFPRATSASWEAASTASCTVGPEREIRWDGGNAPGGGAGWEGRERHVAGAAAGSPAVSSSSGRWWRCRPSRAGLRPWPPTRRPPLRRRRGRRRSPPSPTARGARARPTIRTTPTATRPGGSTPSPRWARRCSSAGSSPG